MFQRPQNIKAESAVIRCVLLQPELALDVFSKLASGMFADDSHRLVFSTLKRMHDDSVALDGVTLRGYLNSGFERIGGESYFVDLRHSEVFPSNVLDYIKAIKNTYTLRVVIDAGLDIAESGIHAVSPDQPVSKLLEYADMLVNDLASDGSTLSMDMLAETQYQKYLARLADPGFKGVLTGLDDFDMAIGGLSYTDLILVAARPSVGKTSWLLSVILNQAKAGLGVGLFSYEMSPEQLFNRLLALESGVSYFNINTGRLDTADRDKVDVAFKVVANLPIYISYATSMGVDEIIASAKKLHRINGVSIFGLDYLQLMPGRSDNRNLELGYISGRLKVSAVKDNCVWMACSQLSRKCEYRENKRPILSDLRDSGSLEQDADMVIGLYRDCLYSPNSNNARDAEILVRKNRNGPIGDLMVQFDKQIMKFGNADTLF